MISNYSLYGRGAAASKQFLLSFISQNLFSFQIECWKKIMQETLSIRVLEKADLEFARLLHNADDTLVYLSDVEHISEPQQEKWFERVSLSEGSRRYVITETFSGDYVGIFRVDKLDWKNRSVCVGLDIVTSKRGNRYSYKIYNHFFNYFFCQCGLKRIYLATLETNNTAQNIYSKLGFSVEGRSRAGLFREGRFQDLIWMSILSDEYECNGSD